MRNSKLMTSMLSAWIMAVAYDYIERVTGTEVNVLLYAAVITIVAGLYFGLYAKDKGIKKEEA